jgi:hypothetical protein
LERLTTLSRTDGDELSWPAPKGEPQKRTLHEIDYLLHVNAKNQSPDFYLPIDRVPFGPEDAPIGRADARNSACCEHRIDARTVQ